MTTRASIPVHALLLSAVARKDEVESWTLLLGWVMVTALLDWSTGSIEAGLVTLLLAMPLALF